MFWSLNLDLPNALSAQAVLVPNLFEGKDHLHQARSVYQNITLCLAEVLHQIANLFGRCILSINASSIAGASGSRMISRSFRCG